MAAFSWSVKFCFLYLSLTSIAITSDATNSFGANQVLRLGQTLISSNQRFELGFFNVSSTRNLRYLGIWYRGIEPLTVVWVANRLKPLRGVNVKLHMNQDGDPLVYDVEEKAFSFVQLNQPLSRPFLVLLDSGNLVLIDGTDTHEKYYWQSFDFPTDTLLPGMKLGWDLKSGSNRVLRSWGTSDDPGYGDFVFTIKLPKVPQLLLEKNGVVQFRWGPWNDKRFSGININNNSIFRIIYLSSPDEVYFVFEMLDDSVLVRLVTTAIGTVQFLKWEHTSRVWVPLLTLTKDNICDRYGFCGPFAACYAEDPGCRCLKGFVVNAPHDWRRFDCSGGCRREKALNCSDGDGFVKYSGLKLPDNFTVIAGLSFDKCGEYCLKECTCMAYTSISIYGHQRECVVWFDKLIDIRASSYAGDELYIRMARDDLDSIFRTKNKKKVFIITGFVVAAFFGATICYGINQFGLLSKQDETQSREYVPCQDDEQFVQLLDMSTISAATSSFSRENKIGQGGFGPVYQGQLENGQKIAVKRLSETSNQGLQEFRNEMNLIAQLQHRNLVKILGCCIEGEERSLIYEYMPNKSLDRFIFDQERKGFLKWETRFSILKGVAKGLDYLHFGSRLRIVHRDLKASNVLLDEFMNPKISDFGLARNCENEKEETTKRVIGTHGYMSPEYVIGGQYSTRSDVYSFGVLALEIISGKRNWGFQHPDHDFNLLGHAWKLWNEGKGLELIDPVMEESVVESEVVKCIKVGLLCAQHSAEDRPTMGQVVCMLENENVRLEEPKEPGFFTLRSAAGIGLVAEFCASMKWAQDSSVNGLTVTDLTGRT